MQTLISPQDPVVIIEKIGYVYIFMNREYTKFKVGFTFHIQTRLLQVEHESGEFLTVYKEWNKKRLSSERDFHHKCKRHPHRLNGEWYAHKGNMLEVALDYFENN